MIIVISPSKSMDFSKNIPDSEYTNLNFSEKNSTILKKLQSLSLLEIKNVLNVKDKIGQINYDRYKHYQDAPEKQALYAYTGDVYKNIDVRSFSSSMLKFCQKHLRILSAFYGIIKPLDKIKPYRLEMSSKLPGFKERNMAEFWKIDITKKLLDEIKNHDNNWIINLASSEYYASIDFEKFNNKIINIHFREVRNNKLKNIGINSKRARGMLTDYIIRNNIDMPDDIKSFNKSGYLFDKNISDTNNFFFVK